MRSGAFRKSVNDLFISRGSVKLPSIRHKKKVKKNKGENTHKSYTQIQYDNNVLRVAIPR